MKPIPKWLMIPPAVALLLVLGPLMMQGGADANTRRQQPEAAQPDKTALGKEAVSLPALPRTPDFWQIGSALVGVLLLGTLGIYGLRRLRGGAVPTRGTRLVTLRQSLRLTQRQALHAIEFDDRILLVGETERGLTLIDSANGSERQSDEAAAAAQAAAMLDGTLLEDDGAVPRDLLIPRPDKPSRSLPTPPRMPRPAAQSANLNEFRSLLQKAGRA